MLGGACQEYKSPVSMAGATAKGPDSGGCSLLSTTLAPEFIIQYDIVIFGGVIMALSLVYCEDYFTYTEVFYPY